jgi:hypothetical protein
VFKAKATNPNIEARDVLKAQAAKKSVLSSRRSRNDQN